MKLKIMKLKYITTTASALFAIAASSANAAIVFNDPSFENAGAATALTMDSTNWRTDFGGNNTDAALSGATVGLWHTLSGNFMNNGQLQDKDSYVTSNTTNPANVNGEQFLSYARVNQNRSAMQFINDGKSSIGTYTFSIDYWVAAYAGGASAQTADIAFEVFAFNTADLGNVTWQARSNDGDFDTIKGTGYISAGGTYNTIAGTAASSGFQTVSYDLNLGTGYDYIGVSITSDVNSAAVYSNFDNLQVSAVPEPSTSALLGLGGLALILRRRK